MVPYSVLWMLLIFSIDLVKVQTVWLVEKRELQFLFFADGVSTKMFTF